MPVSVKAIHAKDTYREFRIQDLLDRLLRTGISPELKRRQGLTGHTPVDKESNFRNQASSTVAPAGGSGLSDSDRDLVMDAIKQSQESTETSDEPRVIVVKQEATPEVITEEKKEEEPNAYNPYNMVNNPYFSYPPDYYYDDDEEEDDWDEEDEDE